MNSAADALEKIHSENLRRQAEVSAAMPQTVMIEVKLPRPKIGRSSRKSLTPGRLSLTIKIDTQTDSAAVVEKTRREITKILGRDPKRYLSSAHAFVIEATGAQLRELAALPSIEAIWPNTRRFVP